jgi:addiction module RelB/DinJ family antitoxin
MNTKLQINIDPDLKSKAEDQLGRLGLTIQDAVQVLLTCLVTIHYFPLEELAVTKESLDLIENAVSRKIQGMSFEELREEYLNGSHDELDIKLKGREMAFDKAQFDRVFGMARYYARDERTILCNSGGIGQLIEPEELLGGISMFEALRSEEGGNKVEVILRKRID